MYRMSLVLHCDYVYCNWHDAKLHSFTASMCLPVFTAAQSVVDSFKVRRRSDRMISQTHVIACVLTAS